MNLEAEILREHSKRQSVRIAKWVGSDKRRFKELMVLFLRGDIPCNAENRMDYQALRG